MNKPFQTVPWFNSKEWQDAYENLFGSASTTKSKREALHMLYIWKARSPFLPSGIEATLSLLEVYLHDLEEGELQSDYLIRLAYSTALMRYVNHMLDGETAKGVSLYKAAKNLGVPDWIVDLRHDTAHSNKLPPLELLRQAAWESLDWLQRCYWDEYKKSVSDFISTSEKFNSTTESQVAALLNFCISLSICSHSECNIDNVTQIPDMDMTESLIGDAVDLFQINIDISQPKAVSLRMFKKLLKVHAQKIFQNNASPYIKKVLLSDDSLFLSDEVYYLFHNCNSKTLNPSYVKYFEGVLYFLHSHVLLEQFILDLINITQSDDDNNRCRLAAQWISVILKALKNYQQFIDRINISLSDDQIKSREENDLKSLYYHWYPNEKRSALVLNLQKPIPHNLIDINFIQSVVSTYNPFLSYFIRDLLNLCQPPLPQETMVKLSKLADLIAFPEKFSAISSKIYTADDISKGETAGTVSIQKQIIHLDETVEVMEVEEISKGTYGIWHTASNSHKWSTCPLGILPWQIQHDIGP